MEQGGYPMKILITGTNSFIGNALVTFLNKTKSHIAIDQVSLKDKSWESLDLKQYSVIFHVAGIAHNKKMSFKSQKYWDVNYKLTMKLAQKAKKQGVKQFIYMSSIIIYGPDTSVKETTPINVAKPSPKGVYAKSKYAADKGLQSLDSNEFKVVIIRSPMVYGPKCKGNFPKLVHLAKWMFIHPLIQNQRSMIYIDHLVNLIYLVIQNELAGIFYPQESQYISTMQIIESARLLKGLKNRPSKRMADIVKIFSFLPIFKKIYGNKKYNLDDSKPFNEEYRFISTQESLKKSIQYVFHGESS